MCNNLLPCRPVRLNKHARLDPQLLLNTPTLPSLLRLRSKLPCITRHVIPLISFLLTSPPPLFSDSLSRRRREGKKEGKGRKERREGKERKKGREGKKEGKERKERKKEERRKKGNDQVFNPIPGKNSTCLSYLCIVRRYERSVMTPLLLILHSLDSPADPSRTDRLRREAGTRS